MKKIHESKNNKKFNSTINKVHAEMDSAKKTVNDWHVRWDEIYSDVYCYDLQFLLETDIENLESKYDGIYDLSKYWDDSKRNGQAIERVTLEDYDGEEYICEFRKLEWLLTNNKLVRNFTFLNNGDIGYSQVKRKRNTDNQSCDYYVSYNVNNNDLSLRVIKDDDDISFINSQARSYIWGNKTILEDEDSILLTENKDERSVLKTEMDKSGNIIRRHLILDDYNYVMEGDHLVAAFMGENDLEIDLDMWLRVTYAMDSFETGKIRDNDLFDYVNQIKIKLINAIKSIKNDVPMDGLLRRLDIALSMISTKKIVHSENPKELRKKQGV